MWLIVMNTKFQILIVVETFCEDKRRTPNGDGSFKVNNNVGNGRIWEQGH